MRRLSYSEDQARAAIAASYSWAESLRRLGLCPTGGAWRVLRKHAARWEIDTGHFLPNGRSATPRRSLGEILVEGSPVRGTTLKERLYAAGLKSRRCEMCGQGEEWNGRRMSLVLDHVNGVRDDNRLENLRILCANCNATLETHCGRKNRIVREPRACARCETTFVPRYESQRYCSRTCGTRHSGRTGPRPDRQRVERPPVEDLRELVLRVGYRAAGRQLGVSDNAVRKWFRAYGVEPPPARGRKLHPPPAPPRALTDDQARAALAQAARGRSMSSIAKELGVSQTTIHDLRHGRTHRHVERPEGLRDAA